MRSIVYNKFSPELEHLWIELEKRSYISVFQTFRWNKSWYETIAQNKNTQLVIVLILRKEEPVVIFPLILNKSFGVRIIGFIGGQQSDYLFPLLDSSLDIDLNYAWSLVKQSMPKHDLIYFEKYALFRNNANMSFASLLNLKEYNISSSITLPETFELFKSKLRSKLKADINRQKRRLSKLGNLKFEIITDGDEFKKLVPEMISQKRKKYRETNVPDPFISQDVQDFYIKFIDSRSEELIPHYSVLKLDDKIIATHWGVIHKGRFYYLMPTYSEKHRIYSPGKILLYYLIEESIVQQLEIFDFSIGGENYKREWCDNSLQIYYYLSSASVKGLLYMCILLIVNHARRNRYIWNFIRKMYRMIANDR